MAKQTQTIVAMESEEKENLRKAAKALGISMSAFMRMASSKEAKKLNQTKGY